MEKVVKLGRVNGDMVRMEGSTPWKWMESVFSWGLDDKMYCIRSRGRCDVGVARRLKCSRSLSMGEDHLNGVCWSVTERRFGNEAPAESPQLGNHGHST